MKKLVFTTALIALGIVSFSQIPTEGLMGFYPFNGDAIDESQNGYNGMIHGAVLTTDRFGLENSAFSFDGINDFIELPISFDYRNRTFSAWFYALKIHPHPGNAVLNCDHEDLLYGTTKLRLKEIDGIDCLHFNHGQDPVDAPVKLNRWYLGTITVSDSARFYLDDKLIATVDYGEVSSIGGRPYASIGVGRVNEAYMKGKIDDVRFYNRALTDSEIAQIYYEKNKSLQDIDGNEYNTVTIGNQVWMAENLKATHYPDGNPIPLVEGALAWNALGYNDSAYCWYDNSTANKDTYGGLYTWAAAQAVCPVGWHLPSDSEWMELELSLSGAKEAGGMLKDTGTVHWNSPNEGATNESGFTALPGGYRDFLAVFYFIGNHGYWWSSSEVDVNFAWSRYLLYNTADITKFGFEKNYGFSVRCIKDPCNSETIMIDYTAESPKCFGDSSGIISIIVEGLNPPFSYYWSNGDTNQNAESLPAGEYTLLVTDSFGCSDSIKINLTQPDSITIESVIEENKCFEDNSASISTTVTGGTTPYHYLWNTGDTLSFVDSLKAEEYSLVISDNNNCLADEEFSIVDPQQIEIEETTYEPLCYGDSTGSIKINLSGGSKPYSISWFNDSALDSISGLSKGIYNVSVTDSNGCLQQKSINVPEPDSLVMTLSKEENTCFGDSSGTIFINTIGGTPGYQYQWSDQSAQLANGNLKAGEYSITVFDENNCSTSESITLVDPEKIVIDDIIGNDQVMAFQPYTYSLTERENFTYHWMVNGGNVLSGQGTHVVEIQWGSGPNGVVKSVIESELGCLSDTAFLEVSISTVGVDLYNSADMRIYPNPMKYNAIIEFAEIPSIGSKLILTDISGRVVREINTINEKRIKVFKNGLPAGLYLIELVDDQHYRGKLFIE